VLRLTLFKGLYKNAIPANQVTERGALMFLLIWAFLLFTSTFTDMVVAGIESAETAGNVAQLMFSLCLIFNGVLASPTVLPGFWIFMYRISPFTYLVDGMLSVGLANTRVQCADIEYLHFNPPSGLTCSQYLGTYISLAGGYLSDASANSTSDCQFCTVADTNTFLSALSSSYGKRWQNFGLMWVYIVFNVFGAVGLYWLARVPRKRKEVEVIYEEGKAEKKAESVKAFKEMESGEKSKEISE
jgi:ATP-binding cassette, subfamily G (WHITE), member 2, PDR